jgi:pimeloyl-ACP methyl ester carboxylesterase
VLQRITAPVLLIRARQGLPIPAEALARVAGAVRDLKITELDGGHHVHLEYPEAVNRAVLEFFAH